MSKRTEYVECPEYEATNIVDANLAEHKCRYYGEEFTT